MGAIEEYKARNAERDARRAEKQKPPEKRRWWFNQPIPIDRFTGWLVAWTALLFCATVANVIVINHTDDKIGDQLEVMKGQLAEMRSSGAQTDELIKATKQAAEAAKQSADATLALERPNISLGEIRLVKPNGENDPNPTIEYTLFNVGRSQAVIKLFYLDCEVIDVIPETPEFHSNKFHTAETTVGINSSIGTNTNPGTLPRCTFDKPISPQDYEAIKQSKKFLIVKMMLLYEGNLDFSYAKSIGTRYDPNQNGGFVSIGPKYTYEDQKNGRVYPSNMPATFKIIP